MIIGLIVLSLVLVLGLAWQAQRAMVTHLNTATNVLLEYGTLVVDEYVRRTMGDVGFYGYYTYMNLLQQQALQEDAFPFAPGVPSEDSPAAQASRLADYVFFFDEESERLTYTGDRRPDLTVEPDLMALSREVLDAPPPDVGFAIRHTAIDEKALTFVIARDGDARRAFGFEVDRAELGRWLSRSFDQDNLLPRSLAGGAITNEYVYLSFRDDRGAPLFESGDSYDPYLLVTRSLGDEYNGIFEGYEVAAAIDPEIAESLVIGGLPRSRLPLLILIFLLTVAMLIAAIRQLQRERAVVRMRTNFVSEVSHELRTPLTQIRMFAETLLFDRVRSDDERQRALEVINREAQRLIHLVENVLQFSNGRGTKRVLRTEHQSLKPIVEQVASEFHPLAEQGRAKIVCRVAEDAFADVDADAVRQILVNLLDNATKYGPAGQMVLIELTPGPQWVRLAVSDEGPGVAREERERIWGGYYRLERERESAVAGTGIGLAVVRELAALQGGRSWVEDGAAGGACFVVEFPAVSRIGADAPEHAVGGTTRLAGGSR